MRRQPGAFVFVQKGCPACHDYMPRFRWASRGFKHPIGIYDLAEGGRAELFGQQMHVDATPTTIVVDSRGQLYRKRGSLAEAEIRALLGRAG